MKGVHIATRSAPLIDRTFPNAFQDRKLREFTESLLKKASWAIRFRAENYASLRGSGRPLADFFRPFSRALQAAFQSFQTVCPPPICARTPQISWCYRLLSGQHPPVFFTVHIREVPGRMRRRGESFRASTIPPGRHIPQAPG